jgi:hypothetical protein
LKPIPNRGKFQIIRTTRTGELSYENTKEDREDTDNIRGSNVFVEKIATTILRVEKICFR